MQSLRKGEHRNQTECLRCGNQGNQNLSFHCEVAELPPWLETKAILQPWCSKHTQNCEALRHSGIIPAQALRFATNAFCMCVWGAADCLLIRYLKFGFWTRFLPGWDLPTPCISLFHLPPSYFLWCHSKEMAQQYLLVSSLSFKCTFNRVHDKWV